jgi:hypothetical protein
MTTTATQYALRARELLQWVIRMEYLDPADPVRNAIVRLLDEQPPQEYACGGVFDDQGNVIGNFTVSTQAGAANFPPMCEGVANLVARGEATFHPFKPVQCPQGCFAGIEARLGPGCTSPVTRYRCLKCDTRWPA